MNEMIRQDFPLLQQRMHNKPLVYLDSSATSQKPQIVLDALQSFYTTANANVHRGVYDLSVRATQLYEKTRHTVKEFIQAPHAHEIIFVRGTTDAINLVAQSYGRSIGADDEILISTMEHHSNIVPWQLLAAQTGAKLKVIPISDAGEMDLYAYEALLNERTKIVSIAHASNALGTLNPIKEMVAMAHVYHIPVLVDGAQAFPHVPLNVQDLDCDFYAFSAHKAYGPTGLGVLYGKSALLDKMPPYQGGGDMIETVSFEKTTFNKLPSKFEAGTPNISAVIAFNEALNYLKKIGMQAIFEHEQKLLRYATEQLSRIPEVRIIGQAANKVGVISFVMKDIHPHDIGTVLDHEGIAIRAGHHCAMPLMQRFQVPATVRMSLGLYNTKEDIDALMHGLHQVKRLFA